MCSEGQPVSQKDKFMSTEITANIKWKSHFLQPVTVCFLLLVTCGWYYGAPDFHWAALRNLAQTGKKCSAVSLPPSSNDNRLHSHLFVIANWQWLSFLKRSQSFFPVFAFHSFKAQPSINSRKLLLENQNPKDFCKAFCVDSDSWISTSSRTWLLPSEHHLP